MFLNVISLLVGFLCLFVVVLMLFNSKSNSKTNVYLIIILFVAGLQRFVNAIEVLGFTHSIFNPLRIRLTFAFFIVPIYYLFFRKLIQRNATLKEELLHFILPTLLVLIDIFILRYSLSYYFYLVFSSYYFGSILLLVAGLVKIKKRSMFEEDSYKTIRTWTLLMTTITFSLVVFSNYFLFSEAKSVDTLNNFYRYSSLLWLGALIYMFRNPIIIFGEHKLLKSIKLNEPQEFLVWNHKPLKAVEEKDKILYNTILIRIDSIIFDIQKLQKSTLIVSKTALTVNTLAKELKIPRSHIELVFRYYCLYSINDFVNLVKINYAVSLIKDGYLEKYTVASLGANCLFNSRFTFSKNFKKFVGVSVSDFIVNNQKSNKNLLRHSGQI
jgi:AraC-like DNA-binding protein